MRVTTARFRWRMWALRTTAIVLAAAPLPALAATCTWSSGTAGNWHMPANWTGCASGNGTPAGTPGPADRAVLPSAAAAALLSSQFTTIAELDMAPGSTLGILEPNLDTRQLTIASGASFNGATLSGTLPPPMGLPPATLSVLLPEGSTLAFGGSNTLRRAIVSSAGIATLSGGAGSALNFDLNGSYLIGPTGTSTITGDFALHYTTSGVFTNQGTLIVQGPGVVGIQRSGASGGQFTCTGLLEIRAATFKLLNPAAGFQHGLNSSVRLIDGTFDGGATELPIVSGRFLRGNGTLIGPFRSSGGIVDPLAADGGPFGVLTFNGSTQFSATDLVLDIGGPGVTQHDRLVISGSSQWNRVAPRIRLLNGYAPGIDTSIPIASHSSVVSPNFPVHDRVYSDYPLSFALRVAPTQTDLRVVPTVSIADTSLAEGNSGTQTMNLDVTLSAPTTETVSFRYSTFAGTAVTVAAGGNAGDYDTAFGTVTFAPGELSRQIAVTVGGDTSVEADEGFSVVTNDDPFTPTLSNASFGNNRRFSTSAEGLIVNDDGPAGVRYLLIGKSTNLATPTGQISFVRRYTTGGAAVDGWATLMQNTFGSVATGFCRAPDGDVLSTRFGTSLGPVRMSASGTVLDGDFGGLVGSDESCAFDLLGNVWVGEAGPVAATTFNLHYMAGDGRLLETLQVPVGARGTDWIELDSDQCTLYYTSEDSDVRRYDVCTRQPLPHFVTGLEAPCYALRQLPNRELMITCRNRIYRYGQGGNLIREYPRESLGETDVNGLYALHLDPDGETFWAGGVISGRVVRARIDDGSVVASFGTGTGGVNGLLVQDEYVAGISVLLFRNGFE